VPALGQFWAIVTRGMLPFVVLNVLCKFLKFPQNMSIDNIFTENMASIEWCVNIIPADDLAPNADRTSAGIILMFPYASGHST